MRIASDPRLFWFLKEGAVIDLTQPSQRDLYVRQVMTHGRFNDVKTLLARLPLEKLADSFKRLKQFLPKEIRLFWEEFLGNPQ